MGTLSWDMRPNGICINIICAGGAELLVVGRESSVSSILGGVARSSASRTGQLPFDSASFVAWHVTHSRWGLGGSPAHWLLQPLHSIPLLIQSPISLLPMHAC